MFSIVVLTHNRRHVLYQLLKELSMLSRLDVEVLIVDNYSQDGTCDMVRKNFPEFILIPLDNNYGAVGRNKGMSLASGEFVITIDDDILGLNDLALLNLQRLFYKNNLVGAICFKVIDYYTGEVCNWCHPNKYEEYSETPFETTEISEGAVVFRNSMLKKTGLYTEELFISHEGADLAARILNHGYEIYYTPMVTVRHKFATGARKSWRRYYYDTRNSIWLAVRNYHTLFAINYIIKRTLIMLAYSIRDGYVKYWIKAIKDTITELPLMLEQRKPITTKTFKKMRSLNRKRPSFFYFLRRRLFSRQIRI